ncbi:MAG: Alpha-amylase-family protein [Myxococcales bacterium]|nr:Alpha-amylase-family protein [Myxococcales bacterium]
MTVVLESPERREAALRPEDRGYHSLFVPNVAAGARYRFRLGDDQAVYADPASRFQPEGPFGPSQIVDPNDSAWTDAGWHGITEPHRQVIYEMHVGTFTREGTWTAAAEQLRFLADLGVTTIEMMPVNDYAGRRGWGYDGVNLYAPSRNYGTPGDLRKLIDRAHSIGLAVILDVVYNHFGPAGNSLFKFAPQYKHSERRANEWGDALNFDGKDSQAVREFFIANAGYWIEEFHFDGLRLDATQAIHDESKVHVLAEIVRRARAAAGTRQIYIVAENEPQDVRLLAPIESGGYGIDSLWNDDFEHTARVALTGVNDGYNHDYRGTPQEIVSALKHGFLYQGQVYAWQRNTRGTPSRGLPPASFVNCLENHDQVANTGYGDRLGAVSDTASFRAMTAVLLLAPQIPMLFQGQETGSMQRWNFFVDHDPELNKLVRHGRASFMAQFARLGTPEAQAALPDPSAGTTFDDCILEPELRDLTEPVVQLHRDLLRLRREHAVFTDQRPGVFDGALLSDHAFVLRWFGDDGRGDRLLLVNLGRTFREAVIPEPLLAPPLETGWKILWSSEHPNYSGHGTPEPFTVGRLAIPAHAAVLCAPDPSRWLRVEPSPPSGEQAPVDP